MIKAVKDSSKIWLGRKIVQYESESLDVDKK